MKRSVDEAWRSFCYLHPEWTSTNRDEALWDRIKQAFKEGYEWGYEDRKEDEQFEDVA